MPQLDAKLRKEYEGLYKSMKVNPGREAAVKKIADAIKASQTRYEAVATSTKVPWQVIAVIHNMEASLSFTKHLHNGDPLTARTVQVPKGRPLTGQPPFSWEVSAEDALAYDKLTNWTDWSIAGTLYKLEGFNGFGSRNRGINTPYLWSFCQHYTKGKFVRDGVWDPNAVSQQCGAALILSQLGFAGSKADDAPKEPAVAKYPGFVLKAGLMDSPHALQVQKRLNERGCGPVDEDGDFGSKTADAVRTFQAQSKDLDGNALVIDGEVGSITWAALFGKASVVEIKPKDAPSELLREVLKVARNQLGVKEKPPGSNAGPEVEAYLKSAGASKGDPWCMAFVFWCFKQAATSLNIPNPCVKTAGVHDHWNRSTAAGARRLVTADATANPATVFPGMVFCINTGGGKGHTGFVLSVTGGTIETIEGNTNSGQGREGIAVMQHSRKINAISLGFVDYAKF